MPKVSVICPTMRIGGLDVICHGLNNQTYRDFELIFVDGLYKKRKTAFEDNRLGDFKIKHVEPLCNPFPINSFCRYSNTGLMFADCELVLFITDYTWLPPDCIEKHVIFHEDNPDHAGYMGPHYYLDLPPLHPEFKKYGREDTDQYAQDLIDCKLEQFMVSLFQERFGGVKGLADDPVNSKDPKLTMPGNITSDYFHAKNESCRLEYVLDINGWDEDLDGSHCYQDSDLAGRLTDKANVRWYCDTSNLAYIVNPRYILPVGKRLRPTESNYWIWRTKKEQGYPNPVNEYNLKDVRQEVLNFYSDAV